VCAGWQGSAAASRNLTSRGKAVAGEEAAAAAEAGGLKKPPAQGGRHGKETAKKTAGEKAELQGQRVCSLCLFASCV